MQYKNDLTAKADASFWKEKKKFKTAAYQLKTDSARPTAAGAEQV
jgi:hypothetical protein